MPTAAVLSPESPVAAADSPYTADDDQTTEDVRLRPRRNPARFWTGAAIVVALLAVAIGGALAWYGTTRVLSLVGLASTDFDTPLLIKPRMLEPRIQANGSVLLPVSGQIVNPTTQQQAVPDVLVQVRDAQQQTVYRWTIPHPVATLAPRASVAFESATVNPPKNGVKLKFVFVGDR